MSRLLPFFIFGAMSLLFIYLRYKKKRLFQDTGQVGNFPSHQKLYDSKKKNELELSAEEQIELSWQFLYDITDYVLKKFSKEDLKSVHNIGKDLIRFGMSYQHVVKYGIISNKKSNAKATSEEREAGGDKKQISL